MGLKKLLKNITKFCRARTEIWLSSGDVQIGGSFLTVSAQVRIWVGQNIIPCITRAST